MTPFADWVSTSHPVDDHEEIVRGLRDVLDAAGFSERTVASDTPAHMFDVEGGGLVRVGRMRRVSVVSTSGVALGALRGAALFGDYLHVLGSTQHRVTLLHATMDVARDAAPVVADLYARGHAGFIALSRKAVRPADVTVHLSRRSDGVDSGTVYVGGPRDQVRAAVYDKQLERQSRGAPDPGPLTRYEMRIRGKVGLSLRDAWDPAPVFYRVASPDVLPRPVGVASWRAAAEGYTLPPRQIFTAAELMARKLDTSPDIQRLLQLAEECGPHGFELLVSRLRRRLDRLHGASEVSGDTEGPYGPVTSGPLH